MLDPKPSTSPVFVDDESLRHRGPGTSSGSSSDHADQTLEDLGYKPELARNRSTLQVAFMSFVLASIPYGLATTLTYPLVGGGPVNIIWGWVAVSLIIICVAASLGEITSVYPTAGGEFSHAGAFEASVGTYDELTGTGVYYQAFMLAPASWRRLASWICGWLYVVGNITITLAVNFGSTTFFVACINVFTKDDGSPIFPAEPYQVFLIFLGITLLCNAVSAFGNKWLPLLDVSVFTSPTRRDPCMLMHLDCRHLLDFRRRHRHRCRRPRTRQGRPPLGRVCLRPL